MQLPSSGLEQSYSHRQEKCDRTDRFGKRKNDSSPAIFHLSGHLSGDGCPFGSEVAAITPLRMIVDFSHTPHGDTENEKQKDDDHSTKKNSA